MHGARAHGTPGSAGLQSGGLAGSSARPTLPMHGQLACTGYGCERACSALCVCIAPADVTGALHEAHRHASGCRTRPATGDLLLTAIVRQGPRPRCGGGPGMDAGGEGMDTHAGMWRSVARPRVCTDGPGDTHGGTGVALFIRTLRSTGWCFLCGADVICQRCAAGLAGAMLAAAKPARPHADDT